MRDWGRYVLTIDRNQAELIFVVRTGRVAEAKLGGSVGVGDRNPMGAPGQQRPIGTGVMLGAAAGPPDDLLRVCLPNGSRTLDSPIWTRSEKDGLAGPEVPLLQQLKKAVEHDYPPATSQPAKP